MNNNLKNGNFQHLSQDEIVIKGNDGKLKIWFNGDWHDFDQRKEAYQAAKENVEVLDTGLEGPFLSPIKPSTKNEPLLEIKQTPFDIKPKKYSVNKIVDKVEEILKLKLNPEKKKRLKNILFSYARHTRSYLDGLDFLQKEAVSGGLEFTPDKAEKTMAVARNILDRIEREAGEVIDEEKTDSIPKIEKNLQEALKKELEAEITKLETQKPVVPPATYQKPPLRPAEPKNVPTHGPISIKPKMVKKFEEVSDFPRVKRPEANRRRQISEVRKKPVILGPVEELASFSLSDFRRLGENAGDRATKIFKKINSLAEESLTKKAEGINAWRKSEVYKMYITVGQESITQKTSVKQIISQKQQQTDIFLTLDEFYALSDLNKKLRF